MTQNRRIVLSEQVALWVTRRAVEENTSAGEFVDRILERQMRADEDYGRAYRAWKRVSPVKGIDAARRMSREDTHVRR